MNILEEIRETYDRCFSESNAATNKNIIHKLTYQLQHSSPKQFTKAILYNSKNIKIAEFILENEKVLLKSANDNLIDLNDDYHFKIDAYYQDFNRKIPFSFIVEKKPFLPALEEYVYRAIPTLRNKLQILHKSPSIYNPDFGETFDKNISNIANTFNSFSTFLKHIKK